MPPTATAAAPVAPRTFPAPSSRARRAASRREIGLAIPVSRSARPSRPAPTALIADDSGDARYCLTRMLEQLGLRVETAADGKEAATKACAAAAAGRPFDLILMDLTMPVLDGLDATRQIRAAAAAADAPAGPIIAITGDTFPPTREQCRAAGCTGYYHGRLDFAAVTSLVAQHVPAAAAAARRLAVDW
jgi:CheY-like chemotaxis protein